MIAGNVPKHLVVAARTGFLVGMRQRTYPWQRVAMTLNMTAAAVDLVDLGAAPMPTASKSGVTVQDFIEKTKPISTEDWDITVWISQNAISDDQTGSLERRVRSAGDNFQKHTNKRVFEVLNGGDGTTFGLCYDGQEFFDSDHVDKGAHYQTAQDNEYALGISLDNFETVWVAAQVVRDDQGEFTEYVYDLLVTHPTNKRIAAQITDNVQAYDTASREMNPFTGDVTYLTVPYYDTTAWHLVASNETVKPIIVAMKEMPHLQSAWFDPKAPDGGRHYFKFFGRYEMHYGDWRLVLQGNT
jgi:phage major head subunit gpT-like protein